MKKVLLATALVLGLIGMVHADILLTATVCISNANGTATKLKGKQNI